MCYQSIYRDNNLERKVIQTNLLALFIEYWLLSLHNWYTKKSIVNMDNNSRKVNTTKLACLVYWVLIIEYPISDILRKVNVDNTIYTKLQRYQFEKKKRIWINFLY